MQGTEGARSPFWSPDSASVGFVSGIELKRVSLPDSTPISLCRLRGAPANFSATWSPDGSSIVWSGRFSPGGPPRLYEVSAQGGRPELLIELEEAEKGKIYSQPTFLAARSGEPQAPVLYRAANGHPGGGTGPRDGSARRTGQRGLCRVFPLGTCSLSAPPERLQCPMGPAFLRGKTKADRQGLPDCAKRFPAWRLQDGTLVYLDSVGRVQLQLVWRSRNGEEMGKIGQPQQNILYASLSPDGRFVATRGWESDTAESDVWLHDVAQPIKTRLTFAPAHDTRPLWSPTGDEVTFASKRRGELRHLRQARGWRR